ncbi:MAG: bacillithiol biosynthesis deacetylase BshB1 [Cyclobacteriaceae bacterium]|nr:bacillithiol biosynthesis deacetylase BshB1 [Cyclobacteriaceae bacterium]
MKLDLLVFAAHPDDAELACSGTIAAHLTAGYKCGIVDLTKGEMGTRGNPELRMKEAEKSSRILDLQIRENLGFADIKFLNDWEHQLEVIKMIRKYRPDVILANAIKDRHPDHGKAAELLQQAFFKSGLTKIHTQLDGEEQEAYRAKHLYHYIQNDYIEPSFIVDISDFWDKKLNSIMAFESQFHNPDSDELETFISSSGFLESIEARAKELGHRIGVKYGEGFTMSSTPGVRDVFSLL